MKTAANIKKHGVSFEEAVAALKDDLAATARDLEHSGTELRFITFGVSELGRLLAVSLTERDNTIRIISTRSATRMERKIHEKG